jgi:hypothetical protein
LAYALLFEGACETRRVKRSARRQGARGPAAATAALFALAAAGCFTSPINHAPHVVVSGDGMPVRKQMASFKADVTDQDGDVKQVLWAQVAGVCTDATDPTNWPPSSDWHGSMSSDPRADMLSGQATDTPSCVWVFAIDSHGAISADNLTVTPKNQAPMAQIAVVAPEAVAVAASGLASYPLYSTIQLSSAGTFDPDGDPLMNRTWTLTRPNQPNPAPLTSCNDAELCSFTADATGQYDISFTTSDGTDMGTKPLSIFINQDQPPCIANTNYSFRRPAPTPVSAKNPYPDAVEVDTVSDDGDPYPSPTSHLHFRWYIEINGQGLQFFDHDYFSESLVGYDIGDVVKLRVEVLDRNPATEAKLYQCGDADSCTINGNLDCSQRVTWTFEFE